MSQEETTMTSPDKEARMLAKIETGERIESQEEMTEEYRASLIHLMTMQADSELAGGYGYVPWIMKAPGVEEKHVVAQIVKDEIPQATFGKWYIRTMNIFGRPGSAKNALYRKYRLKLRDNDEVRRTFAAEVKDKAGGVGLTVPEWAPVWDRLPEEAQIPG